MEFNINFKQNASGIEHANNITYFRDCLLSVCRYTISFNISLMFFQVYRWCRNTFFLCIHSLCVCVCCYLSLVGHRSYKQHQSTCICQCVNVQHMDESLSEPPPPYCKDFSSHESQQGVVCIQGESLPSALST